MKQPNVEIYIGKAAPHERETEICSVCGRPCTAYGQIDDHVFYFCEDHDHLATEANLVAEYDE